MRWDQETEQLITAQIAATPDRPLILPDHCYWGSTDNCIIHLGDQRVQVLAYLYTVLVGPIPDGHIVRNRGGIPLRNVNPHVATCYRPMSEAEHKAALRNGRPSVSDIARAKTHCPQNHPLVPRGKDGKRRYCPICHKNEERRRRARTGDAEATRQALEHDAENTTIEKRTA